MLECVFEWQLFIPDKLTPSLQQPDPLTVFGRPDCNYYILLNNKYLTSVFGGQFTPALPCQFAPARTDFFEHFFHKREMFQIENICESVCIIKISFISY